MRNLEELFQYRAYYCCSVDTAGKAGHLFMGGMDDAGKEYPVLGEIYVNSK